MQVFKRPPRDDRPVPLPSAPDRKAALERAEYIAARYFAPPAEAERAVATMDIPTQTMLAIEMDARRQSTFTADYDPFGGNR